MHTPLARGTLVLLALLVLVFACPAEGQQPGREGPPATRLRIENREYRATAEVWRDLMPGPERERRDLLAIVRLESLDGSRIPASWSVDRVVLQRGIFRWTGEPEREPRRTPPGMLEAVVRKGPPWKVGGGVTVVFYLRRPGESLRPIHVRGVRIQAAH